MMISGLLLTAGLWLAIQDPGRDDLQKLQGTWLTVSLVSDGKTVVDENLPPKPGPVTRLVYEGNQWKVRVGEKTVATGTWKIDATKTPKELDILDESGLINDKTKRAIYELEGDTFKYCIGQAGKPRPTEFSAREGSGDALIVSRREKP
ncbi:MAG TPA: TIGR03067 domain-containing protein [Thermoanaerobaculia bacterium]|nr:TIGR03067 domain-containing protein [Thermoanaerobaculia bacterium]